MSQPKIPREGMADSDIEHCRKKLIAAKPSYLGSGPAFCRVLDAASQADSRVKEAREWVRLKNQK